MVKLFVTVLMAILAVIYGCPYKLYCTDTGELVSYNGSIVTFQMGNSRNGSEELGQSRIEQIKRCIRTSIVRDQSRVELMVERCCESKFAYERELKYAFTILQSSSLWIVEEDLGLVRLTQCYAGGWIRFDVSIDLRSNATDLAVGPCRTIANGSKILQTQNGWAYDARDLLPKGSGSMMAGQATMAAVLSMVGAVAFGGY